MEGSSSILGTGKFPSDLRVNKYKSSKAKTIGVAIAIIFSLGGLAVAGVGIGGYFQVGSLSNLSQLHSIIMMAAGGGGGIVCLIIGIVVKHRVRKPYDTRSSSNETGDPVICGRDSWKKWNVEVVEKVPKAPKIPWDANDPYFKKPFRENYALFYIPQKIRVDGKEKDLTLETLNEIRGNLFDKEFDHVKNQIGQIMAPGWVLLSTTVIPGSRGKDCKTQQEMVEAIAGFHMPLALEAAALNLMVDTLSGKQLYGNNPWTYTRCREKVDGEEYFVVGGFNSHSLIVAKSRLDRDSIGVAVALRIL